MIAVLIGIILIPNTAKAAYYTDENGVTYRYTISEEEATIQGINYPENITNIVIPNEIIDENFNVYKVTNIENYLGNPIFNEYNANYKDNQIESITIPSELKIIGKNSFKGCIKLETINFEDGSNLEKIGENAFNSCTNLKTITIPSKVEEIGKYAFCHTDLETIIFAENSILNSIGECAFDGCTNLEQIQIPSNLTMIGSGAFEECSKLKRVEFAEHSNLKTIGSYAFYDCIELKNIKISKTVETIEECAFAFCSNIETILFEEESNLKTIGDACFYGCSNVKTIEIPKSVENIIEMAFMMCENLETVTFEEESSLKSIGNDVFSGCNKLTEIKIPKSVKSIDGFQECENLKSIIFEEGNRLQEIGYSAFYGCSSLENITIPATVTEIGYSAFEGCNNIIINCRENSEAHKYAKNKQIEYNAMPFEASVSYAYDYTVNYGKRIRITIELNERLDSKSRNNLIAKGWYYSDVIGYTVHSYSKTIYLMKDVELDSNIDDNVYLMDCVGNELTVKVDTAAPEINIRYSYKNSELNEIVVMIIATEPVSNEISIIENGEERIEEWEYLSELTQYILTKTFNKNTNVEIKVKDLIGNYSEVVELKINWIDEQDYGKYSIGELYIEEVLPRTTKEEFIENLGIYKEGVEVVREDEEELGDGEYVGTRMKAKKGEKEYTIIVKGDITGEGEANLRDILQINKHRLNKIQLEEVEAKAADANRDKEVDIRDILRINKYRLGKLAREKF